MIEPGCGCVPSLLEADWLQALSLPAPSYTSLQTPHRLSAAPADALRWTDPPPPGFPLSEPLRSEKGQQRLDERDDSPRATRFAPGLVAGELAATALEIHV